MHSGMEAVQFKINRFVTNTQFVLCVVGKRSLSSWILVTNGQYGKQLQVNFYP